MRFKPGAAASSLRLRDRNRRAPCAVQTQRVVQSRVAGAEREVRGKLGRSGRSRSPRRRSGRRCRTLAAAKARRQDEAKWRKPGIFAVFLSSRRKSISMRSGKRRIGSSWRTWRLVRRKNRRPRSKKMLALASGASPAKVRSRVEASKMSFGFFGRQSTAALSSLLSALYGEWHVFEAALGPDRKAFRLRWPPKGSRRP